MNDPRSAPRCFVCRCEEVDAHELREAIGAGARTINDVKRRTRAGMGICQGVYCLEQVAALLAEETGGQREAVLPMTSRPPARLLTVGSLAALVRDNPDD
jgi:NAD(P)H-nitrite reductase large subunit